MLERGLSARGTEQQRGGGGVAAEGRWVVKGRGGGQRGGEGGGGGGWLTGGAFYFPHHTECHKHKSHVVPQAETATDCHKAGHCQLNNHQHQSSLAIVTLSFLMATVGQMLTVYEG